MRLRGLSFALALLTASACNLALRAEVRPRRSVSDWSAKSAAQGLPSIQTVMILTPSGTSRGAFDGYLHYLERALLARSIRVVSAAVTGRVVQERTSESASQLTDLERALIMQKETGADALLQVGAMELHGRSTRWLCGNTPEALTDCTEEEYRDSKYGRALAGDVIRFSGRLIDARTGEVVAVINLASQVVEGLDCKLFSNGNTFPKLDGDCSGCTGDGWWCRQCRAASMRALDQLFDAVVARIASGGGAPAQGKETPVAPPTEAPAPDIWSL